MKSNSNSFDSDSVYTLNLKGVPTDGKTSSIDVLVDCNG
jgi:hypothetical protein